MADNALVALSMLGPDPRTEADLRWLWCWAEGEMGLCSGFPAMVAQLEAGGPMSGGKVRTDLDPRALEAAGRARGIVRALERAFGEGVRWRSSFEVHALRRALSDEDARRFPAFGKYAGAAVLTKAAQDRWHIYWCGLRRVTCTCPRTLEEWLVRLAWRAQGRAGMQGRPEDRRLALIVSHEAEVLTMELLGRLEHARRETR